MRRLARVLAVASLAVSLLGACTDRTAAPTPAGSGVSEAERRAIFEKARANAEKNNKVTRRPRRFSGDSL